MFKVLLCLLVLFVIMVIAELIAALEISVAVKHFKQEKYFSFGTDIVIAITFIALALKMLFLTNVLF